MTVHNMLGLFIHWGIFALTGFHEQAQFRRNMSVSEYGQLAQRFNPVSFDARAWVREAKSAGMGYICYVTKHHDGFCMYDTAFSDYKVTNTPFGRDPLAELAAACAEEDVKLSLYYSIPDWHRPDTLVNPEYRHYWAPPGLEARPDTETYLKYVKSQLTELLTNYGRIHSLFWDIPPGIYDPTVNAIARRLQPGILINDRGFDRGDMDSPERTMPGEALARAAEACQSLGHQSWGYRRNEDWFSCKFIEQSIDSVMARGGSYLLNVGPTPEGTFPPEFSAALSKIGGWFARVRESLEDTEPRELGAEPAFANGRDDTVYVHLQASAVRSGIVLKRVKTLPARATLLNTGAELKCELTQMPEDFDWVNVRLADPYLHVYGIPVDELESEQIVIKLEF